MRICYVTHARAHFSVPYLEFFASRGHEVHVISPQPCDVAGITCHQLVESDFDPYRARLVYFWLMFKVRGLIKRIRPNLVHALYMTSNGLMAAASGFHPLVVTAMGSDVHNYMHHPLKRALVRFVGKRADLVNAVSAELEQKLLELGISPGKMFGLTHGIETARFLQAAKMPYTGPPRIICTRKLFPVYQPEMIVEALRLLKQEGLQFRFQFAATGPMEPMLRAQVDAGRLTDCVSFRGGYLPAELPQMLAESDVYVSASKWDGTSPALLEAMSAGVYPVVTDIPANREWLIGTTDGQLIPVGNSAAMMCALVYAIQNRGVREAARPLLQDRARTQGDRATNLARLESAYQELVARHATAARRVPS